MKASMIRKTIWVFVILCFCSGYVISYDNTEVSVTITNGTQRYVHILINNQSFVYVGPGGSAYTSTMLSTAMVEVFYSPGQGISGRAAKELTSTTTTTYSGSKSNTCQNNNSSGCAVNESDTRTATYSRSPMSWRVTPQDFSADTTSNANQ